MGRSHYAAYPLARAVAGHGQLLPWLSEITAAAEDPEAVTLKDAIGMLWGAGETATKETLAGTGDVARALLALLEVVATVGADAKVADIVDDDRAEAAGDGPETDQHVLVYGNPFDGLSVVGPVVPNDPDLEDFTDRELRNEYWWYVPMQSLAAARVDAAGV